MSYRVQKLIATILCIIGIISLVANSTYGGLLLVGGFIWFVILRIFADTARD